MTARLDISIGPVQGFVSQSRRTRDLWGSSYLLAFLSAHAMHGASNAGGKIIQPVVDGDPLYLWACGRQEGKPPQIGSLPNHFVVEVSEDQDMLNVAKASIQALNSAWKRVCDAVWEQFVEQASPCGDGTCKIWTRQVTGFWEIMWTASDADAKGGPLARRKRWRTHRPAIEPGDKCTVMHDLQELSGHVRAWNNNRQDEFWDRIRNRLGSLDLRDNERLCAVALVKRLFPKVSAEALGWEVDTAHWPSTVYVGAVPWIRQVVASVPDLAREYASAARRHVHNARHGVFLMQHPPFAGLNVPAAGDFPKLDANYLHREFVASERLCPLTDDAENGAREKLDGLLRKIYAAKNSAGQALGPPPTFYALLLADGDRLGKLVSALGGKSVSHALACFTGEAPKIIKQHQGVTIYAGGDDVLAMLPVPGALTCANALSDAYQQAFAETSAQARATLSAAVVFAGVRLPLNHLLGEAHRLLDDVAKNANGRDSLAAAVLKPGGLHCQWATAWIRPGDDANAVKSLQALVGEMERKTADGDAPPNTMRKIEGTATQGGLSSSLTYRIRETLATLCGWDQWLPGHYGDIPAAIDIEPFLYAEILHSLEVRMDKGAEQHTSELTARVLDLLRPARNSQANGTGIASSGEKSGPARQAGVDALLLARFLADPEQQEPDR